MVGGGGLISGGGGGAREEGDNSKHSWHEVYEKYWKNFSYDSQNSV